MLAYLRGTLQSREITGSAQDKLVVDVGGIGFEVSAARNTVLAAGEPGSQITLQTALVIRENDWTVYGFHRSEDRDMFNLLQSVTGVGPKLALALVGTLGVDNIVQAVTDDDQKLLSQAPGVGNKVAQRLILELKSKIEEWQSRHGRDMTPPSARNNHVDEARTILEGLGYTATEISLAFKTATEQDAATDVELLVRHSLKVLGAAGL